MRKMGNTKSNALFNPDPQKHPAPISQDDQDSNMERHIRAKYEYQTFQREPGSAPQPSTSSSAATIPPPPSSKSTGKSKFGLGMFRSSPPNTKASQILGTGGAQYSDKQPVVFPHGMASATPLEQYGDQIKSLHEMGFTDVTQCMKVLNQTDGKMMDTVEILIRLNKAEERRPAPPPKNPNPAGFGLAVHRTGPATVSRHRTGGSSNPFDALDREEPPLPPLPSARTGPSAAPAFGHQQQAFGGFGAVAVGQHPWGNGFAPQQQQQQQNMSPYGVAPQNTNPFGQMPQQLYPSLTGGPQQQRLHSTLTGGHQQIYPATTGGSVPATPSYNPFMALQQPVGGNPYQEHLSNNPQQQQQQQFFQQQPQQQQQQPQPQQQAQFQQAQFQEAQPQQQQFQPQQPQFQPQFQSQQPQSQFQPQQPQFQPQHQNNPYAAQPPQQQQPFFSANPYADKSHILALYNAPQLAPPRSQTQVEVTGTPPPPQQQQPAPPPAPSALSNNPFLPQQQHSRSQESVDFGAWQSGRHSPDAFASLAFGGR